MLNRYILLIPLIFASCATDTPDVAANARNRAINQVLTEAGSILGRTATQTLFNVARSELTGDKVDYGQSAAAGLWANVNAASTASAIQRVIQAYSGEKAPQTAAVAAQVASPAITPEVVDAVASVISAAVGSPPSK